MLKRLNPFTFLTGFDRGTLAEPFITPFITFWPGSTTRPLPSAAILLQHAGSRRGDSSFEGRAVSVLGEEGRGWNSGELAEDLLAQTSTLTSPKSMGPHVAQSDRKTLLKIQTVEIAPVEGVQYYQRCLL